MKVLKLSTTLAVVLLVASHVNGFQGRALLSSAADRVKPGTLSLCTLWQGDKIEIEKAFYGNFESNLVVDVTEKIEPLLASEGPTFQVLWRRLSLTDPAPRLPKSLKVIYKLNGVPQERLMAHDGFMTINHIGRTIEELDTDVIDARFAPDGKAVVYGKQGVIKTIDLQSRKVTDVGHYSNTNDLTWFTWGADNNIYYADGEKLREVHQLNLKSGENKIVNTGAGGRVTVSYDGTRLAWVMPPVAGFMGGKRFRYQGGCGGAVSTSGRYLTSNLTTTHKLLGIFEMSETGPSEQMVELVKAPQKPYAINGFHFGRNDEWVCYTVEGPAAFNPTAYLAHWPSGQHIFVSEKQVIKDFYDDTQNLPDGSRLEKIAVSYDGPLNLPIDHLYVNVGQPRKLKVAGYYRTPDNRIVTPALGAGLKWAVKSNAIRLDSNSVSGLTVAEKVEAVASFEKQQCAFEVTVLPELKGEGFTGRYFSDGFYQTNVLTRVDPTMNFQWEGSMSPDEKIDGRRPWSVEWNGELEIQVEGTYTFGIVQGEGNDNMRTLPDGTRESSYGVWLNGESILAHNGKNGNYPWVDPRLSEPKVLKPGKYPIKVRTVDASGHPVVVRLTWSGPGFNDVLLGKPNVYATNEKGKVD